MGAECSGEPTCDTLANSGFISDEVGDVPAFEPSGEAGDEWSLTGGVLEMAAAVVYEYVDGAINGKAAEIGLGGKVHLENGGDGVIAAGLGKLSEGIGGGLVLAGDVEGGDIEGAG